VRPVEPLGRALTVAVHQQRETSGGSGVAHARELSLPRIGVVIRQPSLAVSVT
jgi:hypothetical protein